MEVFYFTHNRSNSRSAIPERKILHYDITFLLSGEMHWRIDGEERVIHSGDILLIDAGSVTSREPLSGCDYFSFNFYSDEENELPSLMSDMLTSEVRMLLSACEEVWGILRDFEVISSLLDSLLKLLKRKIIENDYSYLVREIKKFVSDNIHGQITLEDIAAATFFSTVYCSAVFKRETGMSIIDYVLDEKIKLAKFYIMENMALKQVAEYLGYSDYNYFSRIFKKRTGITPMEYRKSYFH